MSLPAVLLLAFAVQGAQTAPDGIGVQARIAPDTARIGEVFRLTVSVSGVTDEVQVAFPELPDTGTVVALGPPLPIEEAREGTRVVQYELAAWEVGELAVPAAAITVETDAAELVIPLPGIPIHVVSVLPSTADPDTLAMKPPADVVGGNWSLAEKLAGAGLALALAAGLVLYAQRRSVASPVPIPEASPPRERALAELAVLEESGLAEAQEFKGFFSALSQIVREFLAATEERWGLDLTTPELIAAVGADGIDPSQMLILGGLLVSADQVKFARLRPSLDEAVAALASARRWIAEFEPPMEAEEAESADGVAAAEEPTVSDEDAAALFDELFALEEPPLP